MTGSTTSEDPDQPSPPGDVGDPEAVAPAATDRRSRAHPSGGWWPLVPVALLTYLPFLLTRPGWISADTKTYLYLDPGRLLGRAWSIWDPNVGLGTVSHQTIGYLWPMGPWYWFFETIGVPDWIAQRLWWGTLLFATTAGAAHLFRRFELPALAVWPAALVVGLTPYSVAYLGRLSGVMLPLVGLPWLLAFTIQAIRSQRWRHPALFALTVTTVGSVNLTALVLVGIAPLLWLPWAVVSGESDWRGVVRATLRIGLLTVLTSAWWLAGLSVQASHGIDIVRYTESAEVVARTALAFEVLRGLGYWFFYGGDKLELWIEPSFAYTKRRLLLLLSFVVPGLALLSNLIGRWRHRLFFGGLLVIGVFLSVGPHPWNRPSVVGGLLKAFLTTDRGLAFRSLPRAVPLVALSLGALIAGLIGALRSRNRRVGVASAALVTLAAILGMIPLWQRSIVQDSLARRDVPDHWMDAIHLLDERDDGSRVLETPGSDFASYRWGNTVDPITPGLMDRPYVARELVPWGSALAADLVNDLDLLLQERTLEPAAIAPIARLMRVGDLAFRGDLQYERYALARPRQVWDLLRHASGLGDPIGFGEDEVNRPVERFMMWDETWMLDERLLPDGPAVAVVPVEDHRPILDAKPATGALMVSGDGAGLVAAAEAELIDGHELVRYSASIEADAIRDELDRDARLLVTDTNRRRGERWGSLRHNRGETERVDQVPLVADDTDNRLPRFPEQDPDAETTTIQEGSLTVEASSYGNPITFAADDRAALAVDGDPETAWATAAFSDARGERLRILPDEPVELDHLVLTQLDEDRSTRMITRVRIDFGDGDPIEVVLDPISRVEPGQRIDVGARTVTDLQITILDDDHPNRRDHGDAGPVGFVEVVLGDEAPTVTEIVRMPTDLVDAVAGTDDAAGAPLTYLFKRLRQDPTDRTRDDEERGIARRFRVPSERTVGMRGTARLSARAEDPTLDRFLLDEDPDIVFESSHRLAGSRRERAAAAFDGDDETGWIGAWALTDDEELIVRSEVPRSFGSFDLTVINDGLHSVPRQLDVLVDGETIASVALPDIPDEDIDSTATVPVDLPTVEGRELRIVFTDVRPVASLDWTANEDLDHPIGVVHVDLPGIRSTRPEGDLDDRCRTDLVTLDGEPLGIRLTGSVADAEAGRPLALRTCDDEITLTEGDHDLVVEPGFETALDVDLLVMESVDHADPTEPDAELRVTGTHHGPVDDEITIDGLVVGEPVWVVLGQSHNDGWRARVRGGADLGAPQVVDGFANGWLLDPTDETMTIDLTFTPQKRVDIALGISALGVVAALVLAIRRPRDVEGGDVDPDLRVEVETPTLDLRSTLTAAFLVFLAGWLLVSPPVGVALALLTAAAAARSRARWLLRLAPPVLLGVTVLGVLILDRRHRLPAGIEWVSDLRGLHPVAAAAVLAFGAELLLRVLGDRAGRSGDGTR